LPFLAEPGTAARSSPAASPPLGIAFVILNRWVGTHIQAIDDFYFLLTGLGLILTAIFNPIGIAGAVRETTAGLRRKLFGRRAPRCRRPRSPPWRSASTTAACERSIR
jgi:branched-chain amino acid transport system permease protein